MHTLKINNTSYSLASEWHELSATKLKEIIFLLVSEEGTEIGRKIKTLLSLVKIKRSDLIRITPEQMLSLIECIDWMFKTYPDIPNLRSFRLGAINYLAPKGKLENSTLIEFVYADTYFEKYIQTRDVKFLDKLIACIYRPKRNLFYWIFNPFSNDYRIKFNTVQVDRSAYLFSMLPLNLKFSILLFYTGCRKYIVSQYSPIFDTDEYKDDPSLPEDVRQRMREINEINRNNKNPSENNFGWLSMANNISKSGQYGDYEKTMYTNLHTILYNLSIDIVQAKNKIKNSEDASY